MDAHFAYKTCGYHTTSSIWLDVFAYLWYKYQRDLIKCVAGLATFA